METRRTKSELLEEIKILQQKLNEATVGNRGIPAKKDGTISIEKELEVYFSSTSDLVITFDKNGRYLKVLYSTQKALPNYHADELVGKTLHDIYPKDEADYLLGHIINVCKQKRTANISYISNIGNENKWYKAIISYLDDNSVLFAARNIIESKKEKNLSREIEIKYQMLFESANDAILLIQEDRFVDCNSKSLEIFGCTREKILSNTPYRFSPSKQPDGRDSKEKALEKIALALDGNPQYFEWVHCRYDGSPFDAEISLNKVEFGEQVFLQTLIRDVSERKRAIKKIKESEKQFRLIWENSKDGMRLADSEGLVIMVNDAFCKMVGKERNELENKLLSEAYLPLNKKRIIENHQKRVKSKTVIPFVERELTLWNGKKVWFGISNSYFNIDNHSEYILATFRDISERKQSEAQIKMLAQALKSISESVTITDMNDNILFVNQAFIKTYGYDEDEIIGQNINIVRSSNNSTGLTAEIMEKTTLGAWQGEILNRKKDGTEFPILLSTSIVKNEREEPIALIGVATDITIRKQNEEKINLTLSLLHATLESTMDGILVVDKESHITGYNQRFVEMWQIPNSIIKSKTNDKLLEFAADQLKDPEQFLSIVHELYQQPEKEGFDQMEFSDGRIFERYSLPQRLDDKIVGRVWSFSDVTERFRSERTRNALFKISEAVHTTADIRTLYKNIHVVVKELMPANNFYIALYDNRSNLISFPYFVDEKDRPPGVKQFGNGLTEYVLKKGENVLITKKEVLDLNERGKLELLGEPPLVWLGITLKHDESMIGVMAVQDYENEQAYGENEKKILTFISEQVALAIDRKKTADELIKFTKQLELNKSLLEQRADELARLNKHLARSESKLKEINSAKDKLFSIIAHDLRSPFHPLLGISEILVNERQTLTEDEINHFSRELHQAMKQQYSLLENLLNWASVQTGKMKFNPIKINLLNVVEHAIDILHIRADKKDISFKTYVSPDHSVTADPNSLQSIFQNLISNAVKFTNPGGRITIKSSEISNMIEVEVADNGVGMEEEIAANIFQLNSRSSTLGTANEKGTGLGLVLCKELIEKDKGEIRLESQKGKGTKIKFTLPVHHIQS